MLSWFPRQYYVIYQIQPFQLLRRLSITVGQTQHFCKLHVCIAYFPMNGIIFFLSDDQKQDDGCLKSNHKRLPNLTNNKTLGNDKRMTHSTSIKHSYQTFKYKQRIYCIRKGHQVQLENFCDHQYQILGRSSRLKANQADLQACRSLCL